MGTLQLNNEYRVETDERNFILQQLRIVQDEESPNFGKESWDNIGFYYSLDVLIKSLARRNLLVFFPDFEKIRDANKEICEVVERLNASLNIPKV